MFGAMPSQNARHPLENLKPALASGLLPRQKGRPVERAASHLVTLSSSGAPAYFFFSAGLAGAAAASPPSFAAFSACSWRICSIITF